MIKIAFFDIDGTILPFGHKQLSEKMAYTLKRLQEKGVLICEATGRGKPMMPELNGISFDVHMTYNGSYCYSDTEDIYSNPLKQSDVLQILANARKLNRGMVIAGDATMGKTHNDRDIDDYAKMGSVTIPVYDDFEERCRDNIYQIMIGARENEYDAILENTERAMIVAWWDRAVDVIPVGSGKGIAVEKILKHYGFKKEESIAFGDGGNDIAMLKAAGTGVAMGDAGEEVKASADEVCGTAEQDGIYYYCLEKGLI